jgi:hypothetical protein
MSRRVQSAQLYSAMPFMESIGVFNQMVLDFIWVVSLYKSFMCDAGQFLWMEHTRVMVFIASPRLTSLSELMDMKVYLADIPIYDVTRELVLLNQQRIAEIDVA